MDNNTIISVRDLHVNFYNNDRCNRVIRGVNFDLKKGKILCVVGESGCGKSVTANAIMGLLPDLSRIEQGEIHFYDNDQDIRIDQLPRKGREMRKIRGEGIAMIFQDPMTSLNPVFTVGYQINEALLCHHQAKNKKEATGKSIELLKQMGIPLPEKRVGEYPHQFSGGMSQRAMIAMAMSCHPKVLIADEPTTALDVTIQAQIFELMLELDIREVLPMALPSGKGGQARETLRPWRDSCRKHRLFWLASYLPGVCFDTAARIYFAIPQLLRRGQN